jgi:hypothetical protein
VAAGIPLFAEARVVDRRQQGDAGGAVGLRVEARAADPGYDPGDFYEVRIQPDQGAPNERCPEASSPWKVPCSRPNHGAAGFEIHRREGGLHAEIRANHAADPHAWDAAHPAFMRAAEECLAMRPR